MFGQKKRHRWMPSSSWFSEGVGELEVFPKFWGPWGCKNVSNGQPLFVELYFYQKVFQKIFLEDFVLYPPHTPHAGCPVWSLNEELCAIRWKKKDNFGPISFSQNEDKLTLFDKTKHFVLKFKSFPKEKLKKGNGIPIVNVYNQLFECFLLKFVLYFSFIFSIKQCVSKIFECKFLKCFFSSFRKQKEWSESANLRMFRFLRFWSRKGKEDCSRITPKSNHSKGLLYPLLTSLFSRPFIGRKNVENPQKDDFLITQLFKRIN